MKRFALGLMRGCGIFALARNLSANMARILTYHNFCGPEGDSFEAVGTALLRSQLEYLKRHYRVVPLAELIARLHLNRPIDDRTVVMTIDDGRRNCYEFLFPLLQEFEVPATFFVVSSFIRKEDWLWTDKVLWLSEQPSFPSTLDRDRLDVLFRELDCLRPEMRNARIGELAETMDLSLPKQAPPKYAACSWDELRTMTDSGLVEIGSHTVSHPILASISDEESWDEISKSRTQIEEGVGSRVVSFCFPNGKLRDYRQSQILQVKDAGYSCAVVTEPGMVSQGGDLFQLPRIGVSGRCDPLIFAKSIDGAEYYQERIQASVRPPAQSRSMNGAV